MNISPYLFIDFDGVVNFFSSKTAYRKRGDTFGYTKRIDIYDGESFYAVNWSSDLVKKLNALKEATGFTWLWHTTWLNKSVELVDPRLETNSDGFVDWDAWGDITKEVGGGGWSAPRKVFTVTDDELDEIRDSRKYAALKAYVAANPAPFVWVDDSATRKYDPADFVGVLDVPHLVIRPSEDTGIVHWEYEKMVKFFTEHSVK